MLIQMKSWALASAVMMVLGAPHAQADTKAAAPAAASAPAEEIVSNQPWVPENDNDWVYEYSEKRAPKKLKAEKTVAKKDASK